uniref:SAM-dependent methyltransferase n=1 Tax=Amycolatopsis sp. CA-096443 TaxID=3239919 RepID=UPI003F498289
MTATSTAAPPTFPAGPEGPPLADLEQYAQVLGDELRRRRKELRWTRKQLHSRLASDIELQTLGTYELGTRQVSVVRLAELCAAMYVLPQDLLARVHERILPGPPGRPGVRLVALAAADDPGLAPLSRWAETCLRQAGHPGLDPAVPLEPAALAPMAALCGLPPAELAARLDALGPRARPDTTPTASADPPAVRPPAQVTARNVGSEAARWQTPDAAAALARVAADIRDGTLFTELALRGGPADAAPETATIVAASPGQVLILGHSPLAGRLRALMDSPANPAGLRLIPPPPPKPPSTPWRDGSRHRPATCSGARDSPPSKKSKPCPGPAGARCATSGRDGGKNSRACCAPRSAPGHTRPRPSRTPNDPPPSGPATTNPEPPAPNPFHRKETHDHPTRAPRPAAPGRRDPHHDRADRRGGGRNPRRRMPRRARPRHRRPLPGLDRPGLPRTSARPRPARGRDAPAHRPGPDPRARPVRQGHRRAGRGVVTAPQTSAREPGSPPHTPVLPATTGTPMPYSPRSAPADAAAPVPSAPDAFLQVGADRWLPQKANANTPCPRRIRNWFLVGDTTPNGTEDCPWWTGDERWCEHATRMLPHLPQAVHLQHAFLDRAVRAVRDRGVRRFLLIGHPTPLACPAVDHLLASGDGRIVCATPDPLSTWHWQDFADEHRAPIDAIQASFAVPGTVLFAPETRRLLSPGDPICLVLDNVLDTVRSGPGAAAALRCHTDRLPPGSTVIATHATADGLDPAVPAEHDLAERARDLYEDRRTDTWRPPLHRARRRRLRTRDELAALLAGLDLLDPGITHTDDWRNPRPAYRNPAESLCLAAVAAVPATAAGATP